MDEQLKFENPVNVPIREIHQDCTIIQRTGSEEIEFTGCKDIYIFASGTVIVLGIARDTVLNSAAGPIKIVRTGNDPSSDDNFDENQFL